MTAPANNNPSQDMIDSVPQLAATFKNNDSDAVTPTTIWFKAKDSHYDITREESSHAYEV